MMVQPAMVRDLAGTVSSSGSQLGVLIVSKEPTPGMKRAAAEAGFYRWPATQQTYPVVQILTVEELLNGKRPNIPMVLMPYLKAPKLVRDGADQVVLDL